MMINTSLIESLSYTELQERLDEVLDALGQVAFIRKHAHAEPYTNEEEREERLKFLDSGEEELNRLKSLYQTEMSLQEERARKGKYCVVHNEPLAEDYIDEGDQGDGYVTIPHYICHDCNQ